MGFVSDIASRWTCFEETYYNKEEDGENPSREVISTLYRYIKRSDFGL
jgi:hypothetical protein